MPTMSQPHTVSAHGHARRATETIIWAAIAVVLILAWAHPDIRHLRQTAPHRIHIEHIRDLIARWGPWAPLASVFLLIAHTFVPLPVDPVYVANGAAFGFKGGLVVSWVGTMASACLAFGVARALGRPATARIVPQALLEWADTMVARGGWTVALTVRFIPLFPFSLLNFALGLTPLSWPTFLWTTGVGILPNTIVMVAAGYSATGAKRILPLALLALFGLSALGTVLRYRLSRPAAGAAHRTGFLGTSSPRP